MIGERNIDSGKLPFRKEEGQQFPCEICLPAFLPSLTKKWLKMLAMTQELSIDLPLSNRVANQISNIIRTKSDETDNSQSAFCTQSTVCSLQSAVCSLQYALCTDRFVSRTVLFRECPLARRVDLYLYVIKLFKIPILSKRSYGPSLELSTV